MPNDMKLKAFLGPGGWYAAFEDKNGYHYLPPDGGRYPTARAALAATAERPPTTEPGSHVAVGYEEE